MQVNQQIAGRIIHTIEQWNSLGELYSTNQKADLISLLESSTLSAAACSISRMNQTICSGL